MDLSLPTPSQRSTYTVSGLIDRVRGDLNMRNNRLITDQDVVYWAQEAQDLIATETHWFHGHSIIMSTSGQAEYGLPDDDDGRVIAINGVRYNTRQLFTTSEYDLDVSTYLWRSWGPGFPVCYYLRGNNILGLFPAPSSGQVVIDTYWTATPPTVVAPQDNYYVPNGFQHLIITYCKMLASEKDSSDESTRRLQTLTMRWNQGLEKLKIQVQSAAEGEITAAGQNALSYSYQDARPIISFPPFTSISPQ